MFIVEKGTYLTIVLGIQPRLTLTDRIRTIHTQTLTTQYGDSPKASHEAIRIIMMQQSMDKTYLLNTRISPAKSRAKKHQQ